MPQRREDEDPAPAERYLHLPTRSAGDLGAAVARAVIEYFSDAENLAGVSGSVLLLIAVARGRRLPLIPALMISGMGQLGGRMAYRSYKNLEILTQVALKEKGSEGS